MSVPQVAGSALSYNNYQFPPWIKTRVTETPVMAGDGRTVKYSNISIATSGWLTQADQDAFDITTSNQPLDAFILSLRRKLQVNGKVLKYVNKGYGSDLTIDNNQTTPASLRDVAMGPKAGRFVWWPLGGAPDGCHGAGFEWEVSTAIAECGKFNFRPGLFVDVNCTITYDTDEAGIVTITYRGSGQIALSLRADNSIETNVDQWLDSIIAPPPSNFLRRISRTLSPDRATVQFSITDRQIEIPFPTNVVDMSNMKYQVRQRRSMQPVWDCSISGTVRMDPTADRYLAWVRFFNIAAQRIAFIRFQGNFFIDGVPTPIDGRYRPVRLEYDFGEMLFKNESDFTIKFQMVGGKTIDSIIRASGLWRNVPAAQVLANNENWDEDTWAQSLRPSAQATKGVLGATFNVVDEVIIDICNPRNSNGLGKPPGGGAVAPFGADADDPSESDLEAVEPTVLGIPMEFGGAGLSDSEIAENFPPESSWIAWYCVHERVTDHRQVRHKPLSGTVSTPPAKVDPFGDGSDQRVDASEPTLGWTASVQDKTQQTSSPSMTVRLIGAAIRVAYRVNPPKLLSYGGVTPVLKREVVRESTIGIEDNVSMYRTDWELTYIIPGSISGVVPLLSNPMLAAPGDKRK